MRSSCLRSRPSRGTTYRCAGPAAAGAQRALSLATPLPCHATGRHGRRCGVVVVVGCTPGSLTIIVPTPPAANDAPPVEDQPEWQACVQLVQQLGFTDAQASGFVQRAFGWGSQAYWRQAKVREPPSAAQVSAALAFLAGLGLGEAQVAKVVKAFPEIIACSVEEQLAVAAGKLEKDWKLSGTVRANAVVRQPTVLGYCLDCEGSCIGECNRCWARF